MFRRIAFLLALPSLLWFAALSLAWPDAALAGPEPIGTDAGPRVTGVPEEVAKRFKLDTAFYQKHVDYKGFSILSSAKVSDAALLEARYLIDKLLGDREDILKAMIKARCRFMVMAPTEMTTDVPEQRNWEKAYWDKRARGMGGKLSSCGEENLLNLKGDRYNQENILIHEFNHAVHEQGLRAVDPTFDTRLRATFKKAMEKGLWKGTYLTTNYSEYWAEGVQAYFDCMRPQYGANRREKLKIYDPELFALVDEVYKQSRFRYVRYDRRKPTATSKPIQEKSSPRTGQGDSHVLAAVFKAGQVSIHTAVGYDRSAPLGSLAPAGDGDGATSVGFADLLDSLKPVQPTFPQAPAAAEQTYMGTSAAATIVASFDGIGAGFQGPQGTAALCNPSDNSLAVGPDHIVQIVNTRMAIFTKKSSCSRSRFVKHEHFKSGSR